MLQAPVLLSYLVKQFEGETFIKFGSWLPAEVKTTSLSLRGHGQWSHLQEIMGPCSMLPPWILHPEHRTGVLQLSGLNWRYMMVILSGSEVVVVLTGMRFR